MYKYSGGTETAFLAVDDSSNSTHILLDLVEDQVAAGLFNSGDNKAVTIVITKGFKNGRVVIPTPTDYFVVSSKDPTNTYESDKSTSNIVASAGLSVSGLTIKTVARESDLVAHLGYVDFTVEFITSHLSTDYLNLAFDEEIFVKHTSDTITC